jgi:hypothetical protein
MLCQRQSHSLKGIWLHFSDPFAFPACVLLQHPHHSKQSIRVGAVRLYTAPVTPVTRATQANINTLMLKGCVWPYFYRCRTRGKNSLAVRGQSYLCVGDVGRKSQPLSHGQDDRAIAMHSRVYAFCPCGSCVAHATAADFIRSRNALASTTCISS